MFPVGEPVPDVELRTPAGDPTRLAYLVAALTAGALWLSVRTEIPAYQQGGFDLSELLRIKRKNLLLLLSMVAFLYVGCEVAFWNWLPKYLINRGTDPRTAWNILGFGFAVGAGLQGIN